MQFKNLYFYDHPVVPDAIMAQATLDNGKRISVVAGVGLYSTSKAGNRKRANNVEDVSSFEVNMTSAPAIIIIIIIEIITLSLIM